MQAVDAKTIRINLNALNGSDGAVPVLPVADSLAAADGLLGNPVAREGLFRVQTPQTFRFDAILRAHRVWSGASSATDDAQILRAAGGNVVAVAGDAALDKLTYPEDFARAEQQLDSAMIVSTGMGFDVHAFEPGDHVTLGGLRLPHERGLKGHSDADVVLHALCDALLGAIGEGDIGDHFPPSDIRWRNADSALFVEHVRSLIAARGGRITHVDVTIICEAPRVSPHRNAMRERIATLLRLPTTRISIKATTTEGLGFTGRAEGIAAQAIATVRRPEDQ
jgi:2-C-methyl-D-erythritol 4-phosphate cytidylyltransferase/2-C-methyl-D-erythritol 2,4-cyclodiphosphate synthase